MINTYSYLYEELMEADLHAIVSSLSSAQMEMERRS